MFEYTNIFARLFYMEGQIQEQKNMCFHSRELRQLLTQSFFEITNNWGLSRQEQAFLLGWEYSEKRTTLDSMRKRRTIVDKDQDKIERMIDIANIHKYLRLLFPYDRDAVYSWVKVKRTRFGEYTALDIMLSEGKLGITAISRYLRYEAGQI